MAVQLHTLRTMTLGQQSKMYNVLSSHSPSAQGAGNCVIVSTGMPHQAPKSVIQGKRPLAPAPERTSVLVANTADLRCKRKISFMPYGTPGTQQPASVARRNARERNRVKQVNNGFATLRQHIPSNVAAALASPSVNGRGASKKLSKVETLRMAVEYIRSLQQLLDDHESDMSSTSTGSDGGMVDSHYYTGSPDSVVHHQQMSHHPILMQQTPPCSEASASPTPSFSSEGSVSVASTYAPTELHHYSHQESYENYDTTSAEDEELLYAIQLWQQQ